MPLVGLQQPDLCTVLYCSTPGVWGCTLLVFAIWVAQQGLRSSNLPLFLVG
jgi:hypothetical protein